MTIVLNEHDWAEDMILNHSLGKKPFETLRRVARYYLDDGMSKRNARKALERFLTQSDPTVSIPKWSGSISSALIMAQKYPAIDIEEIVVTKPEMRKIDAISGKQTKRLAFTLLCLSKYWNIVAGRSDGWVNNKDCDIMRMANIKTSIKRQSLMYFNLKEFGMIEFSRKVDNTNVRVTFIEDGEPALKITDFRNLGYQYMMFHGGPYFVCANCGITEKIENPNKGKGRWQKYCKSCAAEAILQRRVNYAMNRTNTADKKKKLYTVYMHEFPNGNVYIGKTSQPLKDRWKNGAGYRGSIVGEAIQKFGWENVRHYILFQGSERETSRRVESYWVGRYKSYLPQYGYNIVDRSGYSLAGDDVIQAMSKTEVDGNGAPYCDAKTELR